MASSKQLAALKKLQEFFRSEIQAEVQAGFARLVQIPDSHVIDKLRYYGSLSEGDKACLPRLLRALGKRILWVRRQNAQTEPYRPSLLLQMVAGSKLV